MENNNTARKIHPLLAGAAVSVILVSLAGVAAITGLIPNSHSTNSPVVMDEKPATPPVAASIGAAAAATSPATLVESKEPKEPPIETAKTAPATPPMQHHATRPAHSARVARADEYRSYAPQNVAQAPAICSSCGRVESVQAIQQAAKPSGLGVVAGAVLGGVLGNQVGNGNGRTLATVAGAVGGGYAGNEVERRTRTATSYKVRVRMENGDIRTFSYAEQPAWSAGDRVQVVDGHLTARG